MAPPITDLRQLRTDLNNAKKHLDDADLFRTLLCRTLDVLMLDESDIAHGTGVNRSTVNRWKNGAAVPFKLMRKPVYAFLGRRVATQISKLTGEAANEAEPSTDTDRYAAIR